MSALRGAAVEGPRLAGSWDEIVDRNQALVVISALVVLILGVHFGLSQRGWARRRTAAWSRADASVSTDVVFAAFR